MSNLSNFSITDSHYFIRIFSVFVTEPRENDQMKIVPGRESFVFGIFSWPTESWLFTWISWLKKTFSPSLVFGVKTWTSTRWKDTTLETQEERLIEVEKTEKTKSITSVFLTWRRQRIIHQKMLLKRILEEVFHRLQHKILKKQWKWSKGMIEGYFSWNLVAIGLTSKFFLLQN